MSECSFTSDVDFLKHVEEKAALFHKFILKVNSEHEGTFLQQTLQVFVEVWRVRQQPDV